jgi:DNA-binding Lrp family transcriptional regulator
MTVFNYNIMLDAKSLKIISMLRNNARLPLTKVAKQIQSPVTTTHDYYRRLDPYIVKHTSILDFGALGYKLRNYLIINTNKNKELEDFLLKHNTVNNIYRLNKDQLAIDILFRSMKDQFEFMELLSEHNAEIVEDLKIIDDIKIEEFEAGNPQKKQKT